MHQVLIIGAGNIAALYDRPEQEMVLTYAHAFQESKAFSLKGFYDINLEQARMAAGRWTCCAYQDLDQAMEGIEVVCCCVPDEYHYEVLKQVSKYPVSLVVTEKPLAKTMDEGYEIQSLFQDSCPLLINYSRRFLKEFQLLQREMKNYGKFLKGTGYYGKGIIHNGSHMIDLLNYLAGPVLSFEKPKHALCDFYQDDLSCDVVLKLKNGLFQMTAIDCRISTIFEMDLFFENARVRILDGGCKIESYEIRPSEEYEGYYNYRLKDKKNVDYSGALRGLVENVNGYLEEGQELLCTLKDGLNVLNICCGIRSEIK